MGLVPGTSRIIVAPMAGGVSTPALVVAAAEAGALGFLPGGYLTAGALDQNLTEVETRTDRPYGVNLFLPSPPVIDGGLTEYAQALAPVAAGAGVELGTPKWDDDAVDDKLCLISSHHPAVVSFTFGLPDTKIVQALQDRGVLVACAVSTAEEALAAQKQGVDAVIAQGSEAGGHRAVLHDDPTQPAGGPLVERRELLQQIRAVSSLKIVTAGGITTGAEIADAETLGASAAQLGTAFLCCPEAGTTSAHRRALLDRRYRQTIITRAFTGRPARSLLNPFAERFTGAAPAAYPQVHHLTRPLRAAAARRGDPDTLHLWAGTGWAAATEEPAAAIIARLDRERRTATGRRSANARPPTKAEPR